MTAFLDRDFLQALLDVEVALATAQADVGLIPASALPHIRDAARADRFDAAALLADAERDGNVVIPLVKRLTEGVATNDPSSARYVHVGATSQDILDTALVLRLRDWAPLVDGDLAEIMRTSARLAREHATTPIAGRTWLQQGSPTTFGLKAAGWLDMVGRCRERLAAAIDDALVLELGGATGTLAALGPSAMAVVDSAARALSLKVPTLPWHTHRDRVVDVAAALGITCGALGKIGRDLTLLAQTEIAEVSESPAGGGGSSSMPHKQNPVRAVKAVAAVTRAPGLVATMLAAMPQEHERAAGGWQAEWDTIADLLTVTRGATSSMAAALSELRVNPEQMRINLQRHGGLAMSESLSVALQSRIDRKTAMAHVERLSRDVATQKATLLEVALRDAEVSKLLSKDAIEQALMPESFLGAAAELVERAVQRWNA